ncbi:MAG: hypothetical protein HY471_02660 [Candidatus Sungbacteria bacterium]|nr:hypothetical protein [Candidatus Sungbacteria bacterium]
MTKPPPETGGGFVGPYALFTPQRESHQLFNKAGFSSAGGAMVIQKERALEKPTTL